MKETAGFDSVLEVIEHELFPKADCLLRRGYHISREDEELYDFVDNASTVLYGFYRKYEAYLNHGPEGYYFLVADGDLFGKKTLTNTDMNVGLALAYLMLDPAHLEHGERITFTLFKNTLENLLGRENLVQRFAPRTRGRNQTQDMDKTEDEIKRSLRNLERLGFLFFTDRKEHEFRMRFCILRFVDPCRGTDDVMGAVRQLLQQKTVILEEGEDDQDEA